MALKALLVVLALFDNAVGKPGGRGRVIPFEKGIHLFHGGVFALRIGGFKQQLLGVSLQLRRPAFQVRPVRRQIFLEAAEVHNRRRFLVCPEGPFWPF